MNASPAGQAAPMRLHGEHCGEKRGDAVASDIEILHADAHCIVAVKPAGLLSVPGRGEAKRDCLIARGAEAQRALSIAFARRAVRKRYVALAAGRIDADAGEIDLPLAADWPNRPRQQVDALHGRPSLTRYRVLDRDAARDATRVELEPVTGRAHQLRVHLMAIGHPILGDALYADPARHAVPRLMLHATQLAFAHPASGEALHFSSPPPF